jgi:hypothetical protein
MIAPYFRGKKKKKTRQGNGGTARVSGTGSSRPGRKMVSAPVAVRQQSSRNNMRTVTISENERIVDVTGSTTFAISSSIVVNPGLVVSFPWLSNVGVLYEKYRFKNLVFTYKTLKGTASTGNVLLSFDYDSLDAPPVSAVQMTQGSIFSDGAAWSTVSLTVRNPREQPLYVRSGVIRGDYKTYDLGVLHVAMEGCVDTTVHGFLEVSYTIDFIGKQFVSAANLPPATHTSGWTEAANQTYATGVEEPMVFATQACDGAAWGAQDGVTFHWHPDPGWYLVTVHGTFSNSAAESTTLELRVRTTGALHFQTRTIRTFAANDSQDLDISGCVHVDLGEDFWVGMEITGATGTLTGIAPFSYLTVTPC